VRLLSALELQAPAELDVGLSAELEDSPEGQRAILRLRAARFAQSVEIQAPGCEPADNYFHLAPGGRRAIALRRRDTGRSPTVTVQALNVALPLRVRARERVDA
jgi:beta-mannosidase